MFRFDNVEHLTLMRVMSIHFNMVEKRTYYCLCDFQSLDQGCHFEDSCYMFTDDNIIETDINTPAMRKWATDVMNSRGVANAE